LAVARTSLSNQPKGVQYPPIFPSAEIPDSQLAVLRRGIQAEENSIAFYSDQMGKTTKDPDGVAMYSYLIEQQKAHRTIVQGECDCHVDCLEAAYR